MRGMEQVTVWIGLAIGAYFAWVVYEANKPKLNEKLLCPHCQERGYVTSGVVVRKKGISGGKATGALFTGGLSMLATGLSRKESARHMSCSNCGTSWDVA